MYKYLHKKDYANSLLWYLQLKLVFRIKLVFTIKYVFTIIIGIYTIFKTKERSYDLKVVYEQDPVLKDKCILMEDKDGTLYNSFTLSSLRQF